MEETKEQPKQIKIGKIKSRISFVFLGSVFLFFLMGMAVGYYLGIELNKDGIELNKEKLIQLGREQGRKETEIEYEKRLSEIFPEPPEPEEMYSVWGIVKEKQDKVLIVEQTIYPANPLKEPEVKTWRIIITDQTELVQRTEKSPEELAQEGSLEGEEFLPYKEEPVDFSAFEPGKEIMAEAEENIKNKTEFEATKLILVSPSF